MFKWLSNLFEDNETMSVIKRTNLKGHHIHEFCGNTIYAQRNPGSHDKGIHGQVWCLTGEKGIPQQLHIFISTNTKEPGKWYQYIRNLNIDDK